MRRVGKAKRAHLHERAWCGGHSASAPLPTLRFLRCLPPVDPFGEDDGVGLFIADRAVERAGLRVLAADQQLQFRQAGGAQPGLGSVHDGAAKTLLPAIGIDGDVIDPAAMAVMADHGGRRDRAVGAADQHGRVRIAPRQRDVAGRIVPRPRQAAALPPRNDGFDISIGDIGDGKCSDRGGRVHSTLPGFMIPLGSSSALKLFISSIATLSFTSGSSSRLSTPMPCSAEIEPPMCSTMSNTTLLTSCQRAMKSAVLPPTGWLTL